MHEEAKMVLQLLHKRGFQAYYIGGKCRVELHNASHPDEKLEVKDIDIVTDAPNTKVREIFPNSCERGESFKVVAIKFGGQDFEIATYRKDIYDMKEVKASKKIVRPEVEQAQNLDEDRSRRDFTINTIAEDVDGNYIDYVYTYRNKKVSAMKDIKEGILRAVGNPKQRFEEDPLRIVRMFRFLAQTGYEIETQTLKAVVANLDLVQKVPHERLGPEMNKLIAGRYASTALQMMKELKFFDLMIPNGLAGKPVQFLPGLKMINDNYLNVMDIFNANNKVPATLELWTLLLKPLGAELATENLETFYPVSKDDIERVNWMITNFDIINVDDYRNTIFQSRHGIVKRLGLPCMRDLLKRVGGIYITLYGDEDHKIKYRKLQDAFCMRPYFAEQLKVTGEQMMEIANEGPGPWISDAKEKLLYKLVNANRVPKQGEEYMSLVRESVEEAIFARAFTEAGLK